MNCRKTTWSGACASKLRVKQRCHMEHNLSRRPVRATVVCYNCPIGRAYK